MEIFCTQDANGKKNSSESKSEKYEAEAPQLRNKSESTFDKKLSYRPLQHFAAISANLSLMVCGTMLAWMTHIQERATLDFVSVDGNFSDLALKDHGYYDAIKREARLEREKFYWIRHIQTIGAILGPIPAGLCSDWAGRKTALLFSACPFLLSWIMLIFSKRLVAVCLSRLISGFSIGWSTAILPVYLSEIASPQVRGALLAQGQIFLTSGLVFVYSIGPFVSLVWLHILCAQIPLLFLLIFMFMPDSPYYLVKKGKIEAGERSLMRLRGKNRKEVAIELNKIEIALEETGSQARKCCRCLLSSATKKSFFLMLGLIFILKFSGIDFIQEHSVNYYSDRWWTLSLTTSTIIIGFLQFYASLPGPFLIEYFGRRNLLLLSTFGTTFCLIALGYYFFKEFLGGYGVIQLRFPNEAEHEPDKTWLYVVLIIAYIILHSIGIGPVTWAMLGEMFATEVRSKCVSIITTLAWVFGLILSSCSDWTDFESKNFGAFWFFAFITGVGAVFVYFFIPETKGKTLEKIQEELQEG